MKTGSRRFFRSSGGFSEIIQRLTESWKGPSGKCSESLNSERLRLTLLALSPLDFARRMLGFEPNAAQADVLRAAPFFRQIALNCSRQWGKSTVAAVLAVHRLLTQPGATVLIVSPSGRQSGETLMKVREFLSVMGIRPKGDGVNRDSARLPNGSRIVALPATEGTTRGFSKVSMLIVEEASRLPDPVYLALRPSLALLNGDLILLSTPLGKRGFFYREVTEGDGAGWLRHTGTVAECKRIPEEFLEKERARGEAYFRQEYLCEFLESGKYLLSDAQARKIVKPELEAWKHL